MLKTTAFMLTTMLLLGSSLASAQTHFKKRYRKPRIRQAMPSATDLTITTAAGLAAGINRAAASATLQRRMADTARSMGLTTTGAGRTAVKTTTPVPTSSTRTRPSTTRTRVRVNTEVRTGATTTAKPPPATATTVPDFSRLGVDWSAMMRTLSTNQ